MVFDLAGEACALPVEGVEEIVPQERGLALGADAYILKQKFDQRELLDTVQQIL